MKILEYKFIYFLFLLFLLLPGICVAQKAGEMISIDASTPCWFKASPNGPFAFVITTNTQVLATGVNKKYVIKRGSLYNRVLLNQFVYQQKKYWLAQNIRIIPNAHGTGNKWGVLPDHSRLPESIYIGSIIALFLLLIGWLKLHQQKFKMNIWTRHKSLCMLIFLLLIHYLWIGYFISQTAELGHLPLDEINNVVDAQLILAGDLSTRFGRPLGLSLFYLPFIWFSGAETVYDIAPLVSWIMVLLIAPLGFACAFIFIKKNSKSDWLAFSAILLFLLLPKIYLPAELKNCSMFGLFFAYPANYILTCYYQILSGFNSMSDTLATTLIFGVLFLSTKLRTRTFRYIIVSALFAIACLVRMNIIFFAPLIAYIFYHSDDKLLQDYRYCLKMVGYSMLTFLLFYSPQLLANYHQNGGIFIYPHAFYGEGSSDGFEISKLSAVTHYLMNIHYLYYGVFITACFIMRDSYKRNLLILWVVPMTIFFCGFWLGQPFRFLLSILPGTIVAMLIAIDELRKTMKNPKQLWILGFLLLVLIFPVLPIYGLKQNIYDHFLIAVMRCYIAPFICLLVMGWYWKKREWRCLATAGICSVVFLSSSPWCLFGAFIVLLLWAVSNCILEIIAVIKINKY